MVDGLECFQLSKNTRQQSEKWSSHTAITVIRRIPRYGRQRGSLRQYSTLHGKHYNNKKINNDNSTIKYDKVPEETTSR